MIVCRDCKKEMSCIGNGIQVRYGDGCHVYAGDEFECPTCYKRIIVTSGTPYFDKHLAEKLEKNEISNDRIDNKKNIWMK